ncbi:Sodium/hydrogen exchanger family-domain-containing protein [Morchella snyderi]|nr:Sodium/hydrogen exchanger family-domain-containing protein [Morchella snyderi]
MEASSLPYHEPSIVQVLILSSFGLLLNITNWALERSIYCGLVGQILVGVFWGTPLSGWLDSSIEAAVVQLGYLGLILLVYEGGLSTSISPLLHNLPLSTAVAVTGILLPIALSFALTTLVPGTTPLQCFTAGAALSATSLGTTFTILTSSGLARTRLGTVLTSAAMMDDVVGLIMIQVVAALGTSTSSISGATIGRPIGASLGLLLFVLLACRWIVAPLHRSLHPAPEHTPAAAPQSRIPLSAGNRAYIIHTGTLLALVTTASYAGTSVLLAAFLAGAAITWSDTLSPPAAATERWTGTRVFEHYYAPATTRLLTPFFFASIGFSIPITQLFAGSTVWRGLVYAALMALGKLLTGVWLLRLRVPGATISITEKLKALKKLGPAACTSLSTPTTPTTSATPNNDTAAPAPAPAPAPPAQKPKSLYPPAILGLAMIARGEIGFLIASVAEARGIFTSAGTEGAGGSELYLVVIWATVVCTVLGPVCVGLLVRRVKALERVRVVSGGRESVLGSWGVDVDVAEGVAEVAEVAEVPPATVAAAGSS